MTRRVHANNNVNLLHRVTRRICRSGTIGGINMSIGKVRERIEVFAVPVVSPPPVPHCPRHCMRHYRSRCMQHCQYHSSDYHYHYHYPDHRYRYYCRNHCVQDSYTMACRSALQRGVQQHLHGCYTKPQCLCHWIRHRMYHCISYWAHPVSVALRIYIYVPSTIKSPVSRSVGTQVSLPLLLAVAGP